MSINENSQQSVESLTASFLSDIVRRVQDDVISAVQNKITESTVDQVLQDQISQAVIDHFDQNLKDSVNNEINKRLLTVDFSELISQEIAEKLVPELEKKNWIADEISGSLARINYDNIVRTHIEEVAQENIDKTIAEIIGTIHNRLNSEIDLKLVDLDIIDLLNKEVSEKIIPRLEKQNQERVALEISAGIAQINLNDIVRQQTELAIQNLIKVFNFPDGSIPGRAVDTRNLILPADNIVGGLHRGFESTGIQDRASQCQVTILDSATVFENKLVAGGLEVAGEMTVHRDAVFKGNVIIEGTVKEDALATIQNRMKDVDVAGLLQEQISQIIVDHFSNDIKNTINREIESKLTDLDIVGLIGKEITDKLIPEFETQNRDRVAQDISAALAELNIADIIRQQSDAVIRELITNFKFPDWSIPSQALDPRGLELSADNIGGGVFRGFESTGLQDRASQCQVTILDDATVFENQLVASGLDINGKVTVHQDAVFKGNITVEGTLPEDSAFVNQIVNIVVDHFNQKFNEGTFDQYTDRVFTRIADEGIDSGIVLVGEDPIVNAGTLAPTIVKSNLQSVGALKELQVIGETLLDQTLYASNRRVGINTIEPERVLDIWDQEVQIVAGKRQQDTAIFGTPRNQNLIISAGSKDQLTVNVDGSVTVKNLNIGRTNHSSGPRLPTDNRPMGHIVWNENPAIGSPIGWVSLGGARWAAFGLIAG